MKAVNLYIEPLLVSYGYIRAAATYYPVEYRSPDVVLTVVDERLSYDVGIEFSRLDDPDLRGTLGGLLAMIGESFGFQASTPERLEAVLKRMANLLEKYCGPVLTYRRGRIASRTCRRHEEAERSLYQVGRSKVDSPGGRRRLAEAGICTGSRTLRFHCGRPYSDRIEKIAVCKIAIEGLIFPHPRDAPS